MKKLKKLGSVLLALAVMFVMTSTAFAVGETYSLTITNTKAGHTYNVYQIFTGDISGNEGSYVLSNIKYGANYGGKTAGAKVPAGEISTITDAYAFVKNITLSGTPVKENVESAAGSTTISGLVPGYYLVKDSKAVTGDDAATKYIVQVVGNTSVEVKSSVPSVTKKIIDTEEVDVADYNIGDDVPFKLTGTLPSTLADYSTYKYVFHDTLSEGLTLNASTVKVYLDNDGLTKKEITSGYTINSSDHSLTVSFENVKGITGVTENSKIVVEYTAKLNSSAKVGLPGNENEVYLEFANNPNQSGDGTVDTGSTPKDEVIVFTYELDVTKVDGADENKKLKDAEFKLRSGEKWAIVDSNNKITGWSDTEAGGSTLVSGTEGVFKVIGLDAGTYNLVETKAPTGYNLLEKPVVIEIIATTSNTQSWNGTPSDALTKLEIKVGDTTNEGDTTSGIVSTTVVNNAGTVLPSTGGIGTTLFYVIGGVLVLAAIVLLVTRRRMREE